MLLCPISVPGDVFSERSGHLGDTSKSSVRERPRGKAGRVTGRLRHRQWYNYQSSSSDVSSIHRPKSTSTSTSTSTQTLP